MTALCDELINLISDEALVDKDKLTPGATLADTGLDSVDVISITFAVEEKYGVEIADDAFADIANFGQLLSILEAAVEKKAHSPP